MKFSVHIDIDLPRDAVIDVFKDPEARLKWIPDLLQLEPIEGIPAQPGSKCRLIYRQGSGEIEVIETVIERNLPDRFVSSYTTPGMNSTMASHFEDLGERTRWRTDNTFSGTGLLKLMPWVMPWVFKKRTLRLMQRFKNYAETGRPQH